MKQIKYKLEVYDKTNKLKGKYTIDEVEVLRKYYAYHKGYARENPIRCIATTEKYSKASQLGTISKLAIYYSNEKWIYTIID